MWVSPSASLLLSIACFAARRDSRLESNTTIRQRRFRRRLGTNELGPFRVLVITVLVRGNEIPSEMSEMAPALENHPALKRLSFCGDNEAIVLAVGAGVRFAPVKFEGPEFQRIQRNEQVLGPLITVTALSESVKDEEIVEDRRAKHPIFLP